MKHDQTLSLYHQNQNYCFDLLFLSVSNKSSSIGFYNNFFTEIIIVFGMLIASLPFTLYVSCFRKNFSIIHDSQVLLFLSLITFFVLIVTLWIHFENNINILLALRLSLFNSISIMTGTGYSTENFSNWGYFTNTMFLIMMLVGGCSGSTTGGLKIFRIRYQALGIDARQHAIRYTRLTM